MLKHIQRKNNWPLLVQGTHSFSSSSSLSPPAICANNPFAPPLPEKSWMKNLRRHCSMFQSIQTNIIHLEKLEYTYTHIGWWPDGHKWPNMAKIAIYGHLAIGPCATKSFRRLWIDRENDQMSRPRRAGIAPELRFTCFVSQSPNSARRRKNVIIGSKWGRTARLMKVGFNILLSI